MPKYQDAMTMAYINVFAVLGSIPFLCEEEASARALIEKDTVSLGFAVKNGPHATLFFDKGRVHMEEGCDKAQIRLDFSTPEQLNGMIDGTFTPFPRKGLLRVGFLLKRFTPLTDILSAYLRAEPEKLEDPVFFEKSTRIMLHLIVSAVAEIGNHEKIGMASASYIPDGTVKVAIGEDFSVGLKAENHRLTAIHETPKEFFSYMKFRDIKTARDLFDGKINAVASVGEGAVRVGGMIPQVDNVNRILDRVALYLQ